MDGKWKCRFCERKFSKFEGWEKFNDIEKYEAHRTLQGVYVASTKDKYKDTDYMAHLEYNHSTKMAWCPKSRDVATNKYFKNYKAWLRHQKKYYNEKKISNADPNVYKDILRKQLEKDMNDWLRDGKSLEEVCLKLEYNDWDSSDSESTIKEI